MAVPPKPDTYAPQIPPPGFEAKFIDYWADRPTITPRLQLVHTNAASGEGSVDSAFRHANQWYPGYSGPDVTIPQFQIDMDGRAAMLLPLNRQGIHSYKANPFTIGMETADSGTLDDPTISAFTEAQAEAVAVALAYGSVLYNIPLGYPSTWDGTGSACHTEPFGYPEWTKYNGKTCPGPKKKAQVRDVILPRAVVIRDAWLEPVPAPVPPPKVVTDMLFLAKLDSNPYQWRRGDGNIATVLRSNEYRLENTLLAQDKGPRYYNPITLEEITTPTDVPSLNETQLDLYVGYPAYELTLPDEG